MHQAPAVNGIRSVALQRALVKLSDPADAETEIALWDFGLERLHGQSNNEILTSSAWIFSSPLLIVDHKLMQPRSFLKARLEILTYSHIVGFCCG